MESKVIIRADREGYAPNQIRETMTVSELIEALSDFDENAKIYLSHDNGYTYGGITYWKIEVSDEYEDE